MDVKAVDIYRRTLWNTILADTTQAEKQLREKVYLTRWC